MTEVTSFRNPLDLILYVLVLSLFLVYPLVLTVLYCCDCKPENRIALQSFP